jgi:hypothetical protein
MSTQIFESTNEVEFSRNNRPLPPPFHSRLQATYYPRQFLRPFLLSWDLSTEKKSTPGGKPQGLKTGWPLRTPFRTSESHWPRSVFDFDRDFAPLTKAWCLQPFAKRLALPDSEINKTQPNPNIGFGSSLSNWVMYHDRKCLILFKYCIPTTFREV